MKKSFIISTILKLVLVIIGFVASIFAIANHSEQEMILGLQMLTIALIISVGF